MEATKKQRIFYGYVIVIVCFFMMVLWWGPFNSFGVFFESILLEFGWTRAITATAYSLTGVLMGLFAIPIARLCHKFGPRLVIGVCGFLGGLGYMLMSQISTIWHMYLIYGLLISICMGAYISILPIIARWFVQRRGLMTGVVFSGMGIGMVVIPLLVSQLISNYDWRLSYVVIGIITLLGLVIGAQFLKFDPYEVGLLPYGEDNINRMTPASGGQGFTFGNALRTSQFWLVSAMYFIYLACHTAVAVHIVIYAIGLGVPASSAAKILAVLGIFLVVGFNVLGMTADRVGNKHAFVISFILLAISFIPLLLSHDKWVLYFFAVVSGFAFGGMQVAFSPTVAELFGLNSHGVILGAAGFIGGIGAAVGPVFAGYMFDVSDDYSLAFIFFAILAALAAMLAFILRPPRSKHV